MSWLNDIEDFASGLDNDVRLGADVLNGKYAVEQKRQENEETRRICRRVPCVIFLLCLIAIFVKMYFF